MCIIAAKPAGKAMPTRDTIRTMWAGNPDGAGVMYAPFARSSGTSPPITSFAPDFTASSTSSSMRSRAFLLISGPMTCPSSFHRPSFTARSFSATFSHSCG